MTETLFATPVSQESVDDTLARLLALANHGADREIKPLTPYVVMEIGHVGLQGAGHPPVEAPQPRGRALNYYETFGAMEFSNDIGTMERVLAGLRGTPPGQSQPAPEAPPARARVPLAESPLVTRRFDDDNDTLERVLVGLRGRLAGTEPQPSKAWGSVPASAHGILSTPAATGPVRVPRHAAAEPEITSRHETPPAGMEASASVPAAAGDKPARKPRHAAEPDVPEQVTVPDRRLGAAGFDLSGNRLEMSDRLRRRVAMNPDGEYYGLRRNPNTKIGRIKAFGRRVGSLVLRRMVPMGAGSDSLITGIGTALTHLP
jgi:hypothetical protein